MVANGLLDVAAERYGIDRATLTYMTAGREASKQLYAFEKSGKRYVLRFHRCPTDGIDRVRAEMEWMCDLADRGIGVVRPLATADGELVFAAEANGEPHLITATEMAQGVPWDRNDPDLWNARAYHAWGRVMGEIHRASKDYAPQGGAVRCPEFANFIPDSVNAFPTVKRAADELIAEVMALPRGRDAYGLVHSDLCPSNVRIDGDRITVFDFDGCMYAWFAYDIGCALAVGLWTGRRDDAGHDLANEMIPHFLAGYLSANALDAFWLARIPLFMRMCQIAAFGVTYDRRDPDDERQSELMRNIENRVFLTGCEIDEGLFASDAGL